MNAQARYTDPSARSFTGAAIWLGMASFLVAGIIGGTGVREPGPLAALRPETELSADAPGESAP